MFQFHTLVSFYRKIQTTFSCIVHNIIIRIVYIRPVGPSCILKELTQQENGIAWICNMYTVRIVKFQFNMIIY